MNESGHRKVRAAGYARVSTNMQAKEGHSLDTQERRHREFADQTWGPGNYELARFREPGQSGAATIRQLPDPQGHTRPVLSDLIDRVEAGDFTHVIIYDVDRMAREDFLWKCIRHLFLEPNGVSLRVVSGNLNLDDEDDAFTADILALLASRERALIRRRILDAQESRRQAGYLPTGHPPWGWKWQDPGEVPPGGRRGIVPDPERAPYVKKMADMLLNEAMGVSRIGAYMQQTGMLSGRKRRVWTGVAVHRIVTHPVHAGYIPLDRNKDCPLRERRLKKGQHYQHRFYDPDTYERILQTLGERRTPRTRSLSDENFPLLGVLHCEHCGRRLYAHRGGSNDTRFYRCESSQSGEQRECPGVMKAADVIEAHVFNAVADFATSPLMGRLVGEEAEKLLANRQSELRQELEELDSELAALDDKLHKWADAFTGGKMSEVQFGRVSKRWQQDYDELLAEKEDRQRRLENGAVDLDTMARIRAALADFAHTWQSLPVSRQREILLQILEKLTLGRGNGQLILRLKIRFLPEVGHKIPLFGSRPDNGLESLTDRELALLKLLDAGLSYLDISERWDVSPSAPRTVLAQVKKRAGIRDIHKLIEAARPYIEAALPRLPLEGRMAARHNASSRFTPREKQVTDLLAAGESYRDIAAQLHISYGRVSQVTHYVRCKLGVDMNEEAIKWWRENAHTEALQHKESTE